MNDLAREIYAILRTLVPAARAEITYEDLVERLGPLPPPNQDLQPRDTRLDEALGQIVEACRRTNRPALAAIVVRKHDRVPGSGYYPIAHPQAANDTARAMIAWGNEVLSVRGASYPEEL